MQDFAIRRATPDDINTISDFNRAMAYETEDKDLLEKIIKRGVSRLMQRPEYGFYVVAEKADEVVGTLMITTEWSDWRDGLFWWIQSVYVSPSFRRRGVYQQMYSFIKIQASDNPDVCGFRLYVEKNNTIAQQTYQALGMEETDYLLYEQLTASG
ncbi:GNAT family N-acetyltransferase [Chromatiales bacterium (ex Bugula neritina AB1)]|nr:GNAT family N-acetyltransferase [Chromatiales bacterium (ex Bugula neritina AB1)]